MEAFLGIVIVVGVGYWLFKAGKSTGSRKGYNVGRAHERRRRRRR